MEPRRTMQDIISKTPHGLSGDEGGKPRRSIREITRERGLGAHQEHQNITQLNQENMGERGSSMPPFSASTANNTHKKNLPYVEDIEKGGNQHSPRSPIMWTLAFVSSVLLIVAASTYFYHVRIVVTPMENTVAVQEDITAIASKTTPGIHFLTASVSETKDLAVEATGTASVARKASGQVTIFNSYSSTAQRLIKNTRLETADKKIYRISDSVVVPGTTLRDGKIIPGQVTITVYADAAGDQYNIGLTDFTIPGFAGDPKYKTIIARSKTPMAGGIIGSEPTISASDQSAAEATLQAALQDSLTTQIQAQAPAGYFLPKGGALFSFTTAVPPSAPGDDPKTAHVSVTGTIRAVLLSTDDLSPVLANKYLSATGYVPARDHDAVHLVKPENLQIVLNENFPPDSQTATLRTTLTGNAQFVWDVNTTQLAQDLAGTAISNFGTYITASYPSIRKAEVHRVPFWVFWESDFPSQKNKIFFTQNPPQGAGS